MCWNSKIYVYINYIGRNQQFTYYVYSMCLYCFSDKTYYVFQKHGELKWRQSKSI